jgi:glycosyltransferase involved in cell wall biosynthesis
MAQQSNTQSVENRRVATASAPSYRPLVSIVVPVFNAALTIERCLRSIEAQSYPNWEAIFIDDASEDDSAEHIASLTDPRIRLIRLPVNCGPARARNLGISASRGELVAFLDADDEWLLEKLERQVAVFGADPRLALVICDLGVTNVAGGEGRSVYARQAPVSGTEAWKTLLASSFIATSAVLTRRDLLERVGGFASDLAIGEDQDMFIRLALAGGLHALPERLAIYHWMPHSYSTGLARHQSSDVLRMVRRHLAGLGTLISPRERRHILGRRYERLGRNLIDAGSWGGGCWLLLKAALLGRSPLANLLTPARRILVRGLRP